MTRLRSDLIVSLLVRRVAAAGGFATVVRKGHAEAGAILLQCTKMGRTSALFERRMGPDFAYGWHDIIARAGIESPEIQALIDRKIAADGDLWVVELDVAQAHRFVAELGPLG